MLVPEAVKRLPLLIFFLLAALRMADAQQLSLEVREVASGTLQNDFWRTSWGSYDRVTTGAKTLEVTLRNLSRWQGTAEVTLSFISAGSESGRATADFTFRGELELRARLAAPETIYRTLHLASIGYDARAGTPPATSWIALARCAGTICAVKASSPPMESELRAKIARSEIR